jgi:hypothetical protein
VQFEADIQAGVFLSRAEIADANYKIMHDEFKKGKHTKMFSKKMRARIDGKVSFKHMPLKQTAIFFELEASSRKHVGFTFSVVNYFNTPGGYIYVIRPGCTYPMLFMFTGHFFDRMLQRNIGTNDHAARMTAVFRVLKFLDRLNVVKCPALLVHGPTSQAYLAALGGMCLGVGHTYKEFPDAFNFSDMPGTRVSTVAKAVPNCRDAMLFLTYIAKTQFCTEQTLLYEPLVRPVESAGPIFMCKD